MYIYCYCDSKTEISHAHQPFTPYAIFRTLHHFLKIIQIFKYFPKIQGRDFSTEVVNVQGRDFSTEVNYFPKIVYTF